MYTVDWLKTRDVAQFVLAYVQIAFYLSAVLVAWLTFFVARKGLLSPVNTEYQKRVMDRLSDVASELGEEWNPSSNACYVFHADYLKDACADIDEQYERYRRGDLSAESISIKLSPLDMRLTEQFNRWRSDPFIPDAIRFELLDFTVKRAHTYSDIYFSELGKYRKRLVRRGDEERRPTWFDVNGPAHSRLAKAGFGFDDVARKVDVLRLQIQAYMQRYDPDRKQLSEVRLYSASETGRSILPPGMRFVRKIGDEDTSI